MRTYSIIVLSLPTLACAVWAAFTVARAQYLTTAVALGATLFWLLPLIAWLLMPSLVAWGTSDDAGTTIRLDKRFDRIMLLDMVIGAAALGALAALGSTGRLAIPLPPDIGQMCSLVFGGAALGCLAAATVSLTRPGISQVRLTPEGFVFAEAFSKKSGAWTQVVDITDEVPKGVYASSPITMVMADDSRKLLKESVIFTQGGRALRELIQFYWQHPDQRLELTNGRALGRLHAMQLASRSATT
ncbi:MULTISPECIES: hypothetical protein [Mycolicibacterium]|uniref:hypothetical protein n=1 Tax=Mycolicibacterium TaxID=1866885 RepID=UPI000664528E|nr:MULTISPECIES: hypothetical protein [Mycolicibacterium]